MRMIYAEQLQEHLKTNLSNCYFLCGDEPLLLQESQDHIRQVARQQDFTEHFTLTIEGDTQWESIFRIFQECSLFFSRQTLVLIFPNRQPAPSMKAPLTRLAELIHQNSLINKDILLMLRFYKLTKAQENSQWYQALSSSAYKINCEKPDHKRLPVWIKTRIKSLGFDMDPLCIQRLCECYEGNILALSQLLTTLSLAYPEGQLSLSQVEPVLEGQLSLSQVEPVLEGQLSLSQVEPVLNDFACFTQYQWSNALLEGNPERALLILKKWHEEENEPVILVRTIQPDLLLLITLKRAMTEVPLKTLFQQHQVWKNRWPYFTHALERLSQNALKKAVHLLCQIEVALKQDHDHSVWSELQRFSLLLCDQPVLDDGVQRGLMFFDEP